MEKIRIALIVCFVMVVAGVALSVKLGYPETGTYKVENVERIWNLGAEERGYYGNDCYYMVYTDKAVFKIELSGLNAYAYGVGLIKPGRTYTLKTRGARVEMWGLYPNIINIIEEDNGN
jgi:hypothetical protein